MHTRPCTIEEDIVLLNLSRTHTIEEICRDLARPKGAIEARLLWLKGKEIVAGADGEMVVRHKQNAQARGGNIRPNVAMQKVMEKATFKPLIRP